MLDAERIVRPSSAANMPTCLGCPSLESERSPTLLSWPPLCSPHSVTGGRDTQSLSWQFQWLSLVSGWSTCRRSSSIPSADTVSCLRRPASLWQHWFSLIGCFIAGSGKNLQDGKGLKLQLRRWLSYSIFPVRRSPSPAADNFVWQA